MSLQLNSAAAALAVSHPDQTLRTPAGEQDMALRFWRPLLAGCSDVICADGTARHLPLRMHDGIHIMLPATRFVVVDGSGQSTVLFPGRIHIAGPMALHAAYSLDQSPWRMRLILAPPAAVSKLTAGCAPADAWNGAGEPRQCVVDDAGLCDELSGIVDQLRAPLVLADCQHRLGSCLVRLLAAATNVPSSPPVSNGTTERLERVRVHVRANIAATVSLDELAPIAGLSKFHLLRTFRRAYGVTPQGYHLQLRLARAWRLIVEGAQLSWVAYDAGFADQSHLTRRFARLFGVTPGRLARQLATRPSRELPALSEGHRAAAPSAA